MQSGSGPKNPPWPWARSNVNTNMTGMNPQIMDPNAMMTQQGMMQFQQTQAVFNPSIMQAQSGMAMPMAGQMPMNQMAQGQMYPGNVVAYPTPRAMNPGMYQNSQSNQSSNNTDQRVFTGTVTKTHNDFGFVDHDVFYQTSVCAKGIIPKVNDRVLVEATYNPNMPFKWNATRVQVLPKTGPNQKSNNPNSKSNNYNAVPPLANKKSLPSCRDDRPPRRDDRPPRRDDRPPRRDDRPPRRDERFAPKRSRSRTRSRSRDRRDSRSRRESPPRKRPVVHQPSPIKYVVRVPRMPLDIHKVDVPALSQRYTNLYVPSDFFNAQVKWGETFPPQTPFSINNPCAYHIMNKEVENPIANDAVLEPPDADYRFSAKVMLISMPTLEVLYQKCGLTKVDERDKRSNSSKNPLHPTRLIKFLVGQKGKGGENFAIGGPWSPSLDGENPQSDPKVLVKTAIRTCKALTGVDLTSCTQWYRMVEFYYWREGSGGKSRLECVVLFLPDVWSAQPSRIDWNSVQEQYKAACDAAIRKLDGDHPASSKPEQQVAAAADTSAADKSQIDKDLDSTTITIDENDDDDEKPEPTHYSKIDLKTIKVEQLRQELRARNVSCKGLRAQLVSRLSKLLKAEEASENKKGDDVMELEEDEQEPEKKSEPQEEEKIEIKDEEEEKKLETKIDKVEKKEEKAEEKKTEKEIEEEKRKDKDLDSTTITIDENDDDDEKAEPTHYSKIDLKTIKVEQLRQELRARKVSCKGLRAQLVSRLSKLLKAEEASENKKGDDVMELEEDEQEPEKKSEPQTLYETRYEIPPTPHILVHPSNTAKGGKFNCNVATLSLLLDYRITDNKEHSFELFVFAELFNEMLMRDFGFYIYKTLYTLPEKAEEIKEKKEGEDKAEKKVEEKKDEKKEEKREEKRDEKREDRREEKRDSRRRDRKESPSDDERSGSPKHRSRGVELPPDPYLLLSLVYFDTSRGGSMTKKDLQNLFMSLGLQLSRSQIRAVLEKVCVKEMFNYKTLIQNIKDVASGSPEAIQDLPLDSSIIMSSDVPTHIAELEETIAAGNRNLLPIFCTSDDESGAQSSETKDVSDSGMVMYKSRLVDVGALVKAEARSAAARARLESALEGTRAALRAARAAAASTQQAERGAQTQVSDLSASLAAARARIASLTASSKIFHSALKSIQSKVEAVVNIKYEDDDVVEIVNGPTQSTKEKETKKETMTSTEKHERKEVKESTATNELARKTECKVDVDDKKEKSEIDTKTQESEISTAENMDLDDK